MKILHDVDGWLNDEIPVSGELYKKANGVDNFYICAYKTDTDIKAEQETKWQESELLITDEMLQPDRPNAAAILTYRQALRDYNNHADFPNNNRPTL